MRLYEVFESDCNVYLVQELLSGGELFDRIIQKGNYTERDACVLISQVLQGLETIHKLQIIHRDIKPENLIFKDRKGYEVKLVDFGLSEFVKDPDQLYKRSGTPGYVAPEILKDLHYDSKADIFGAGVILYLLLTGCTPFFGEDTSEIVEKNQSAVVCWDFTELKLHISASAVELMKLMMHPDPKLRPTATEAIAHPWIASKISRDDIINLSPEKQQQTPKNIIQKNLAQLKMKDQQHLAQLDLKDPTCSPLMKASYRMLQNNPDYKQQESELVNQLSKSPTRYSNN